MISDVIINCRRRLQGLIVVRERLPRSCFKSSFLMLVSGTVKDQKCQIVETLNSRQIFIPDHDIKTVHPTVSMK